MKLSRLLRLFLAAMLLAAWQSSLVHPIEHVDGHGGLVHVAGVFGQHDSEDGKASALCDAIAAVASCVSGSSSIAVVPFPSGEVPISGEHGELFGTPLLAYRS